MSHAITTTAAEAATRPGSCLDRAFNPAADLSTREQVQNYAYAAQDVHHALLALPERLTADYLQPLSFRAARKVLALGFALIQEGARRVPGVELPALHAGARSWAQARERAQAQLAALAVVGDAMGFDPNTSELHPEPTPEPTPQPEARIESTDFARRYVRVMGCGERLLYVPVDRDGYGLGVYLTSYAARNPSQHSYNVACDSVSAANRDAAMQAAEALCPRL